MPKAAPSIPATTAAEPLQQMRVLSDHSDGLNDAVFYLRREKVRISVASSDAVTAVAVSGPLIWVGTSSGRLIRHDTVSGQEEEVRGRLGVGRLDNTVTRIYADPYTHAALIILRNADGYHASGTGPVRPRWLAKLRGLRCISASWVRPPQPLNETTERPVALLGTAFGALFSLTIDDKYEKGDVLHRLWVAPNGEPIDGIRVEQVAAKYVGTVATTSTLYLFSDALSLSDLFSEERTTVVDRTFNAVEGSHRDEQRELVLPTELQFMTGNSSFASRRFVWAASAGITHAQLAVKRRRSDDTPAGKPGPAKSVANRSTVIASVQDTEFISWERLKQTSGSSVPLACNLSAFHVLVLYPGSVYAFNQISGQLTQKLTIWSPSGFTPSSERDYSELSWGSRRRSPTPSEISSSGRGREPGRPLSVGRNLGSYSEQMLCSPAAGFARDVLTDSLWIYTEDGEFARLRATHEEQTEAWKAAKAMGRFDLAMALAPLVSSGVPDDTIMLQTREAVLEAQADHAAAEGNWDAAAQLYAKTNRPIETVLLDIVEGCAERGKRDSADTHKVEWISGLRELGIGPRLQMTGHMITYLVRKLDKTDPARPMQRTIIATVLVQLYASQLASEIDSVKREETRKDFGHFLADRHKTLDTEAAIAILSNNGCHDEAWTLAVLSGKLVTAAELSSRRGQVDQTLSLLKNKLLAKNDDLMSQLIRCICNLLLPQAPQKASSAIARCLKRNTSITDHITLVQGLARVARAGTEEDTVKEAYYAATMHLYDLLQSWKANVTERDAVVTKDKLHQDWCILITFLFQLHSEFGTEAEAQRSYDYLLAPRLKADTSEETQDTLGAILRSCANSGFFRLCVFLYQALKLHVNAITLAVEIDVKLAEAKVSMLGPDDMPESLKKSLQCLVASKSDDPVGVVERSRGLLHIEDVLTSMQPFESATDRIKAATANSLEEHKRLANSAKSDAVSALEVISHLREDLETARTWRVMRLEENRAHRHRSLAHSCGHGVPTKQVRSEEKECALCGTQAILSIDASFDTGHTLALERSL